MQASLKSTAFCFLFSLDDILIDCFVCICLASEPSSLLKNIPVIPISKATKRSFMERPPSPERPRYSVKASKRELFPNIDASRSIQAIIYHIENEKYTQQIRMKKETCKYFGVFIYLCSYLLFSLPLRPQPQNSGNCCYVINSSNIIHIILISYFLTPLHYTYMYI